MSVHFHPLTVTEIKKETSDCISVSLKIPDGLRENFLYTHGQYLTIRSRVNNEEVRRSYSICSSPLDNELRIAIKKLEGGILSAYAHHQLLEGDIIEAMPPMGKFFTQLHHANKNKYVAFAAGSGITPLLSIIKTTLLTEPDSQFTLVYGNRYKHSIIFKEQLEALKNRFISRLSILYILSGETMDTSIHSGRIDAEKCEHLFKNVIDLNSTDEFFICGPAEMIFAVKKILEEKGVNRKKIHFELFTTANMTKTIKSPGKAEDSDGSKCNVTIRLDGVMFSFDLAYNDDSILNAALKQGADLPFACKGGVCSTCKAKLTEGKVEMDANYALDIDEIERGFILTCQSHPRTEKVTVDFDIK